MSVSFLRQSHESNSELLPHLHACIQGCVHMSVVSMCVVSSTHTHGMHRGDDSVSKVLAMQEWRL